MSPRSFESEAVVLGPSEVPLKVLPLNDVSRFPNRPANVLDGI